jgi:hypothetical protein
VAVMEFSNSGTVEILREEKIVASREMLKKSVSSSSLEKDIAVWKKSVANTDV